MQVLSDKSLELKMYCDGGKSQYGFFYSFKIEHFGKTVYWAKMVLIPNCKTSNEAEYHALIEGLKKLKDLGYIYATIYSDSKLIVNQVNGTWSVNSPTLSKLCDVARKLKPKRYNLKWVSRKKIVPVLGH